MAGSARRKKQDQPSVNPSAAPDVVEELKREVGKDFKQVKLAGFVAWLAIAILLHGFPGVAVLLTGAKDGASGAQAKDVWVFVLQTAPLTAAIALMGVALLRSWFKAHEFMLFSGVVVVATAWIARLFGDGAATQALEAGLPSNGWVGQGTSLVVQYFFIYGWRSFLASLIAGGVAAWIVAEKLLTRIAGKAR